MTAPLPAQPHINRRQRARGRLGQRLSLWLGAFISLGAVAAALLSLLWTPYPPMAMALKDRLQPPSAAHWLGTDQLGRDIGSLLMAGAQSSLAIALAAVALGALVGIPLGLWAAARGQSSLTDTLLSRMTDVVFAFPALISAILLSATLGPGPVTAALAIGVFNVPVFTRVTRAAALRLWPLDYIRTAELSGKRKARISAEHILPNIGPALMLQATVQFSTAILAEAALSYIGLGARPPIPSWGRMLAEAQTMAGIAPHVALMPGLAIVLTVLGVNLLGEALGAKLTRTEEPQ